jgi:hypothetical protein
VFHEAHSWVVGELGLYLLVLVAAVQHPGVGEVRHIGTSEELAKDRLGVVQRTIPLERFIQNGSGANRASLRDGSQLGRERTS